MKKLAVILGYVLLCGALFACGGQTATPPTETPENFAELVNPGDHVGDLLVTTGERANTLFTFEIHSACNQTGHTFSCDIPEGANINVSYPMYSDSTYELDYNWKNFNSQIYIDSQKINIGAFGAIDFDHPEFKKMRAWNVVIKDVPPGKFTVQIKGVYITDSFDDTWIFTVKPAGEVD